MAHVADVRLTDAARVPARKGSDSAKSKRTPTIDVRMDAETDVPRLARQMRNEWRRERYARLKG